MPFELSAMCDILQDIRGIAKARVPKGESTDAELVFGLLDFGMLGVSKSDALQAAEQNGWMPIMRKTWFCHTPVNGKPCGTCNPCRDAMNEGMRWRMPLSSRLRYHIETFTQGKRLMVK